MVSHLLCWDQLASNGAALEAARNSRRSLALFRTNISFDDAKRRCRGRRLSATQIEKKEGFEETTRTKDAVQGKGAQKDDTENKLTQKQRWLNNALQG